MRIVKNKNLKLEKIIKLKTGICRNYRLNSIINR